MVFISRDKLDSMVQKARREGVEAGREESKRRIKQLEVEQIALDDKIEKSGAELKVLRADRQNVREVLKTKLEAEDLASSLTKTKELQDKREEALNKRAENLDSEEEANYVKGYADGLADGLRKVNEITEKDRENLAKIAMVSAASHTTVEAMREVNSEFRLTEGSSDKKVK